MAEGLWEQAVEIYLAIDRATFVNSQYQVGEPKPKQWNTCLEFLAINFADNEIWGVEVTKYPDRGLDSKMTEFEREYVPRIQPNSPYTE